MKTLCITGGNGLLGGKIIRQAPDSWKLISIDLQDHEEFPRDNLEYIQLDITDEKKTLQEISGRKPDGVIHTAAMTQVDRCEKEKDTAERINVFGTKNVALACKEVNCHMLHLSTDYIFDGESGPYSETDRPKPLSIYGKTKLKSEDIVKKELDRFTIARTMVLYGYGERGRENFATWLIKKLKSNDMVTIVNDQYGTPTLADDLAASLLQLFKKGAMGIYNTAGSEYLNRFEFALKTAKVFNLDPKLILETTTDKLNLPASRPLKSGLKIDKIKKELGFTFSSVTEGLEQMKSQMGD